MAQGFKEIRLDQFLTVSMQKNTGLLFFQVQAFYTLLKLNTRIDSKPFRANPADMSSLYDLCVIKTSHLLNLFTGVHIDEKSEQPHEVQKSRMGLVLRLKVCFFNPHRQVETSCLKFGADTSWLCDRKELFIIYFKALN